MWVYTNLALLYTISDHGTSVLGQLLDTEEFKKSMLEKLMWICAFMLVGAKHQGATVGDVEKSYRDEVGTSI